MDMLATGKGDLDRRHCLALGITVLGSNYSQVREAAWVSPREGAGCLLPVAAAAAAAKSPQLCPTE